MSEARRAAGLYVCKYAYGDDSIQLRHCTDFAFLSPALKKYL